MDFTKYKLAHSLPTNLIDQNYFSKLGIYIKFRSKKKNFFYIDEHFYL